MKSFISLKFIIFTLVSMIVLPTLADNAVEKIGENSLNYRGQGSSPWCFAFAEEQILKDLACEGDRCDKNANQWYASIFDIIQIHGNTSYDPVNSGVSQTQNLFFGSNISFPYMADVKPIRASRCTLEKDIFILNRSDAFNSYGMGLYEFLEYLRVELSRSDETSDQEKIKLYKSMISDPTVNEEARSGARMLIKAYYEKQQLLKSQSLLETLRVLKELAKSSQDTDEYINKVLSYSRCDETIALPQKTLQERTLIDTQEIETLLAKLLKNNTPVLLGICAEVLQVEKIDDKKCGGHAVALKKAKRGEYLIIDSAFFSDREKNTDGSAWIPKDVVHLAISKHGRHLKKVADDFEAAMTKLANDLKAQDYNSGVLAPIEQIVDEFMETLKQVAQTVPQSDIKKEIVKIISAFRDSAYHNEDGTAYSPTQKEKDDNRRLSMEILSGIAGINIESADDVSKLRPLMMRVYGQYFKEEMEKLRPSGEDLELSVVNIKEGGNIIWLE